MFFFEKKHQKTFAPLRAACVAPSMRHQTDKVFFAALFFTKRQSLSYFLEPQKCPTSSS
jgi:hypothetical protein